MARPGGSTWDPIDPGLEPSRVDEKTGKEIGLEKPGRPGGSIRVNPAETQLVYIYKMLPF
jgi:hypothetical protein